MNVKNCFEVKGLNIVLDYGVYSAVTDVTLTYTKESVGIVGKAGVARV